MRTVVVGAGGTLGALLASRLDAIPLEVRATDPTDTSILQEVADADVVVNASGPRVRPELAWPD
jgi:dTDP-4-dehydrorhamnose reductase